MTGSSSDATLPSQAHRFGLTEGVEKAFVADLAPAEARGTAFGMYNLIIGAGAAPASLMMGLPWDSFGATTALMTGAALSLAAVFLLMILVREVNQSPNQSTAN